jgi:thymidylate synthase
MLVSAWNQFFLTLQNHDNVANKKPLPPCHALSVMYRTVNYRVKTALGVPFNIASYALLTMIAQVCDLEPGNSFTLFMRIFTTIILNNSAIVP